MMMKLMLLLLLMMMMIATTRTITMMGILKSNNNSIVDGYDRKAVRATLILVPLFGLQYLIVPVKPAEGTALYHVYHYFVALLTSLQVPCLHRLAGLEVMASASKAEGPGFESPLRRVFRVESYQ